MKENLKFLDDPTPVALVLSVDWNTLDIYTTVFRGPRAVFDAIDRRDLEAKENPLYDHVVFANREGRSDWATDFVATVSFLPPPRKPYTKKKKNDT